MDPFSMFVLIVAGVGTAMAAGIQQDRKVNAKKSRRRGSSSRKPGKASRPSTLTTPSSLGNSYINPILERYCDLPNSFSIKPAPQSYLSATDWLDKNKAQDHLNKYNPCSYSNLTKPKATTNTSPYLSTLNILSEEQKDKSLNPYFPNLLRSLHSEPTPEPKPFLFGNHLNLTDFMNNHSSSLLPRPKSKSTSTAFSIPDIFSKYIGDLNDGSHTSYSSQKSTVTSKAKRKPTSRQRSNHPKQPERLYHGTSLENALEIFNSGLWLVGTSGGVWMGDTRNIAKEYAGEDGAIVVVRINPRLKLKHRKDRQRGYYFYKVPNAKPKKEYYRISGLDPVALLDYKGNTISTKTVDIIY